MCKWWAQCITAPWSEVRGEVKFPDLDLFILMQLHVALNSQTFKSGCTRHDNNLARATEIIDYKYQ